MMRIEFLFAVATIILLIAAQAQWGTINLTNGIPFNNFHMMP